MIQNLCMRKCLVMNVSVVMEVSDVLSSTSSGTGTVHGMIVGQVSPLHVDHKEVNKWTLLEEYVKSAFLQFEIIPMKNFKIRK